MRTKSLPTGVGAVVAACLTVGTPASAVDGRVPRAQAQSLEIVRAVSPVRATADADGALLGHALAGSRYRFGGEVAGPGCAGPFVELEGGGFVCSRNAAYSSRPPHAVAQPPMRPDALLPHRYVRVPRDGVPVYASTADHAAGTVARTLRKGDAFVSFGVHRAGALRFERLMGGGFVLTTDVERARPSRFVGQVVPDGAPLDHVFVLRDTVATAQDGSRSHVERRAVLHAASADETRVRLTDGRSLPREDVRVATPATPPAGVGATERWFDVHIAEQTLTVYEGSRPTYVTLVSTGALRADRRTPTGEFRVVSKHVEATMDEDAAPDPSENYFVESVPFVQYFAGGVALHAAFWHDDFGRARSHGCVNLAPLDARYLFGASAPTLRDGFTAAYASPSAEGTRIRVRP